MQSCSLWVLLVLTARVAAADTKTPRGWAAGDQDGLTEGTQLLQAGVPLERLRRRARRPEVAPTIIIKAPRARVHDRIHDRPAGRKQQMRPQSPSSPPLPQQPPSDAEVRQKLSERLEEMTRAINVAAKKKSNGKDEYQISRVIMALELDGNEIPIDDYEKGADDVDDEDEDDHHRLAGGSTSRASKGRGIPLMGQITLNLDDILEEEEDVENAGGELYRPQPKPGGRKHGGASKGTHRPRPSPFGKKGSKSEAETVTPKPPAAHKALIESFMKVLEEMKAKDIELQHVETLKAPQEDADVPRAWAHGNALGKSAGADNDNDMWQLLQSVNKDKYDLARPQIQEMTPGNSISGKTHLLPGGLDEDDAVANTIMQILSGLNENGSPHYQFLVAGSDPDVESGSQVYEVVNDLKAKIGKPQHEQEIEIKTYKQGSNANAHEGKKMAQTSTSPPSPAAIPTTPAVSSTRASSAAAGQKRSTPPPKGKRSAAAIDDGLVVGSKSWPPARRVVAHSYSRPRRRRRSWRERLGGSRSRREVYHTKIVKQQKNAGQSNIDQVEKQILQLKETLLQQQKPKRPPTLREKVEIKSDDRDDVVETVAYENEPRPAVSKVKERKTFTLSEVGDVNRELTETVQYGGKPRRPVSRLQTMTVSRGGNADRGVVERTAFGGDNSVIIEKDYIEELEETDEDFAPSKTIIEETYGHISKKKKGKKHKRKKKKSHTKPKKVVIKNDMGKVVFENKETKKPKKIHKKIHKPSKGQRKIVIKEDKSPGSGHLVIQKNTHKHKKGKKHGAKHRKHPHHRPPSRFGQRQSPFGGGSMQVGMQGFPAGQMGLGGPRQMGLGGPGQMGLGGPGQMRLGGPGQMRLGGPGQMGPGGPGQMRLGGPGQMGLGGPGQMPFRGNNPFGFGPQQMAMPGTQPGFYQGMMPQTQRMKKKKKKKQKKQKDDEDEDEPLRVKIPIPGGILEALQTLKGRNGVEEGDEGDGKTVRIFAVGTRKPPTTPSTEAPKPTTHAVVTVATSSAGPPPKRPG